MQSLLKNVWYMAGWSQDFANKSVSRRIAGIKIVLFRTKGGDLAALTDRCPHRFAPLSLGEVEDDVMVCPYHGLRFDRTGACVHSPFSVRIPNGARVRAWPVVERDGIAWLWMGAPEATDLTLIPDFSVLHLPRGKLLTGYTPMQANYEFGTDNLMDLSHIEFVHKGSFAGAGVIFAGEHSAEQCGDTLHSNWWMPKVKAPAHTAGFYPPDMITDHWLDMRWNAPASMYLQIGATPEGQDRAQGLVVHQAHILTPETADTTHYFWASTYHSSSGGPDIGSQLRVLFERAFNEEDKPLIEAAYHNLDGEDFWAVRPISLGIDQGGTRARRILQGMLQSEAVAGQS